MTTTTTTTSNKNRSLSSIKQELAALESHQHVATFTNEYKHHICLTTSIVVNSNYATTRIVSWKMSVNTSTLIDVQFTLLEAKTLSQLLTRAITLDKSYVTQTFQNECAQQMTITITTDEQVPPNGIKHRLIQVASSYNAGLEYNLTLSESSYLARLLTATLKDEQTTRTSNDDDTHKKLA